MGLLKKIFGKKESSTLPIKTDIPSQPSSNDIVLKERFDLESADFDNEDDLFQSLFKSPANNMYDNNRIEAFKNSGELFSKNVEDMILETYIDDKSSFGNTKALEWGTKFYDLDKKKFEFLCNSLILKFGQEHLLDCLEKKPWLGMDDMTVKKVLGAPDHSIEKVSSGKKREEYFYGGYINQQKNTSYKFRVVLINGKVDGWNDIYN